MDDSCNDVEAAQLPNDHGRKRVMRAVFPVLGVVKHDDRVRRSKRPPLHRLQDSLALFAVRLGSAVTVRDDLRLVAATFGIEFVYLPREIFEKLLAPALCDRLGNDDVLRPKPLLYIES